MILSIFAWLSIAVFLTLAVLKIIKYRRMPVNLRWDLYPVPHEAADKRRYGGSYMEDIDWVSEPPPKVKIAELLEIVQEVLFLKRLREHNRYGLWIWSMAMHWGLYMLLAWIGILFLGHYLPGVQVVSDPIGFASACLGFVGVVGLILRRTANNDLRKYSSPADYFNLIFLAVIFGLGLFSLIDGVGLSSHQIYIDNMLRLESSPVTLPAAAMFICLQLFAVYMPFSKMIHYVMKHFTFTEILWDDMYKIKGSRLDQVIRNQLDMKPDWKAAHFSNADRWLDEVMHKPYKDES